NVAMADPTHLSLMDELRFRTGLHIIPMVATETDLRTMISHLYGQAPDASSLPIGKSAMRDQSGSSYGKTDCNPPAFLKHSGNDSISISPLLKDKDPSLAAGEA